MDDYDPRCSWNQSDEDDEKDRATAFPKRCGALVTDRTSVAGSCVYRRCTNDALVGDPDHLCRPHRHVSTLLGKTVRLWRAASTSVAAGLSTQRVTNARPADLTTRLENLLTLTVRQNEQSSLWAKRVVDLEETQRALEARLRDGEKTNVLETERCRAELRQVRLDLEDARQQLRQDRKDGKEKKTVEEKVVPNGSAQRPASSFDDAAQIEAEREVIQRAIWSGLNASVSAERKRVLDDMLEQVRGDLLVDLQTPYPEFNVKWQAAVERYLGRETPRLSEAARVSVAPEASLETLFSALAIAMVQAEESPIGQALDWFLQDIDVTQSDAVLEQRREALALQRAVEEVSRQEALGPGAPRGRTVLPGPTDARAAVTGSGSNGEKNSREGEERRSAAPRRTRGVREQAEPLARALGERAEPPARGRPTGRDRLGERAGPAERKQNLGRSRTRRTRPSIRAVPRGNAAEERL